ncbi:hypothetical protein [Paenibacillus pectinilyticus]|nr:hypothetical protein [Paenibacillus pectinilyticus]
MTKQFQMTTQQELIDIVQACVEQRQPIEYCSGVTQTSTEYGT